MAKFFPFIVGFFASTLLWCAWCMGGKHYLPPMHHNETLRVFVGYQEGRTRWKTRGDSIIFTVPSEEQAETIKRQIRHYLEEMSK